MKLASKEDILALVARIDAKQEDLDEHKADMKVIMEGAGAIRLRKDALKSALKLRKLEPAKLTAWLITFDSVVEALGLRAQLDIEAMIAVADAAMEKALAKKEGDGPAH